ncbi:MAG: Ldh family oxidoreductase, partial [Pirellulales bacterium]|nr:Ldh family oxidoreductase [Pirellulales bacterium]
MQPVRIEESTLEAFIVEVFTRLGVTPLIARLSARSLLDASLAGIDSHGIESLKMYVTHLKAGGLDAKAETSKLRGSGSVELWDMQHGMALAGARIVMSHAIQEAQKTGIYMATCCNANHLGACGVYAKMAADEGLIGMVSQQVSALLSPWGGRDARIGTSPFACVAPVENGFPFFYDASMAAITRSQINACRRDGRPLPDDVALDADGNPTRDAQ